MRLIDADALLQEVDELKKSPWFNKNYDWARFVCNETMEIIESLCIDAAPAVDAVEVVRCGQCRNYSVDDPDDLTCGYCGYWFDYHYENDFCNYGEKKQ